MHLRTTLGAIIATALAWTATAAAQAPDTCEALGAAITEHTCFHSRFGPFVEVTATAGTTVGAQTPNIDAVHTHYRIDLTGGTSVVTYTPKRTGAWAIYMDPDLALQVVRDNGTRVSPLRVDDVDDCPFLLRVIVVSLEANQRYRYVFAPSTATQVVIVNEKIDDFEVVQARDADGDGYGDPDQTMVSACTPAAGYVDNDSDCDDGDPAVNPGAVEICDGIDQNCNRVADDVGELCRSGSGACATVGMWACPVPDAPAQCSATVDLSQAVVESCNGVDDDCDGTIDDGDDALCALEDDAPRCVDRGNGRSCGCERDSDCGDAQSGRLCQLTPEAQRCVEGCVDGFGRNGCPAGMGCTSRDPAQPGQCVALCDDDAGCADAGLTDAGLTDAGSDAATVLPDAATETDAGLDAGTPPLTPADGGCQCNAVGMGHTRSQGGWLWLLGPLALVWRRARRRSAMALLLAALMITGCAQSQRATGPDRDAGTSPTVDAGVDAQAMDAPSMCEPALGAQLVDHSCQHATVGRYEEVIATTSADATPPWVNGRHKAYRIAVPTQALAPHAFVRYRPSREGEHVVMVGPSTPAELHDESTGSVVAITHAQALEGCPEALSYGYVAQLTAGRVYRVMLTTDDQSERRLFIEHAETFGDSAWARTCAP